MKINWGSILTLALSLVEPVVKVVEQIADEAHTGATKKQMATDAITGALGVADQVLSPEDQQKAAAVSTLVSTAIDSTVTKLNASGSMPVNIASAVAGDVAAAAGVVAQVTKIPETGTSTAPSAS